MKLLGVKGLAKFERLNDELQTAEAKAFGTRLPRGMERKRELLVEAIASNRSSGVRIGQLVSRYRDHYKIDQTWMPIGESIAHSLGYKSYTSLNSLMKAAKRVSEIPEILLATVMEQGIDLAERKYSQLVNDLRSIDFSGGDEEARVVALAAVDRFRTRKKEAAEKRKKDKAASAEQIGVRIARQVATNLREMPSGERKEQAETIMRHVEAAIRREMPNCIIRVAWVKSVSTTQAVKPRVKASTSHASSRGKLLPIRSPAESPEMSRAPDVTPAAFVDDRSPNSRGTRPRSKLPVRSIESNQLSLFSGAGGG